MRSIVLVCCFGLIAADDGATTAPADGAEVASYQAAASKAGHDAKAHVRLALWCESHGMPAERMKHLAMAVLYDPSNGLARGLMGLVAYQGKWDRPDVVGREIQDDPAYHDLIREYLERRASTARKPDAQARLAAWCEQKGLKEQSIAHYSEVVRLDPSREATWRHLGYKKQGDRWVKPEELAAERLEAERQKHADRQWRVKLEPIRHGLDSKDATRRTRAEEALAQVTDPRAVSMIWAVFVRGSERSQLAAVQMLGQIDGPAASNALAALAVFNTSAEVRGRAIETLARRDPRDVIGRLIGLVRKPFQYEVRKVDGPGSVGRLFVEGERFNLQRFYQDPPFNPASLPPRLFAPSVPFDPFSAQNMMLVTAAMNGMTITPAGPSQAAAQQAARGSRPIPSNAAAFLKNAASAPAAAGFNPASNLVYQTLAQAAYRDMQIASAYQAAAQATQNLQQRLAVDIQAVEATNAGINDLNRRVLPVLGMITGQDFGAEPEKWKTWWTDQLGYVYQSNIPETKPTLTDTVTVTSPFTMGTSHTACFAAGTLVATLDGPRAIESIQVGDRVLSQDPTTGLLSFRPVVTIHRNRPSPTFRIAIDGETIVATGIHRFWKAGKGWTMARDLKPGDRLRVVGGTAEVLSVQPDAAQPVYNLDVADDRDFFVGSKGLLVHDFSFVQPVAAPFDREPDLTAPAAAPPSSMLGPKGALEPRRCGPRGRGLGRCFAIRSRAGPLTLPPWRGPPDESGLRTLEFFRCIRRGHFIISTTEVGDAHLVHLLHARLDGSAFRRGRQVRLGSSGDRDMIGTLLICCALAGAGPDAGGPPAGPAADRSAYEQARKDAGRDAGAHLRLALWCEEQGMSSERMKHLAMAVLYDPSNALARGLMGLVAYKGRWGNPEDVGRTIQDDPSYRKLIDEYLERRAKAPHQADAQMKLATWCQQKGLEAQAIAHYNVVVQLDPSRELAWKHLGYKKSGGRWVKPEEAAAARLEAERQRRADKQWRPKLEKMRDNLDAKDAARKARAERARDDMTEPRAVPMIWAVFISGGTERSRVAAVQMLGQIEGPSAAAALATLAVLGPEGKVRARAAETLMRRDPRDIVDKLIGLIRKPFTYTIRQADQPGSVGELFVEGETFDVRRVYRLQPVGLNQIPAEAFSPTATTPAGQPLSPQRQNLRQVAQATARDSFGPLIGSIRDPDGEQVAEALASNNVPTSARRNRQVDAIRQDVQAVRQRLAEDIRAIEQMNAQINQVNGRVLPILSTITGQDLGPEPEKWKAWWTDQLGYAFQKQSATAKPVFTEVVDSPSWSASLECFGAGTLVRTIDGPRAIESIQVGDRVLTQDTCTGTLGFQPVLAVHHTKMAGTVRVTLDGETVIATGIHRFWRAGKGWALARDLKPGDRIRALGAVLEVKSVDPAASQPVYNLDVAEDHDFFVGGKGLLVHDSNFVQPVLEPFDRPASARGE